MVNGDQLFSTLIPAWPLPSGVRALITTRTGAPTTGAGLLGFDSSPSGITSGSYGSDKVQATRNLLAQQLGESINVQWLQQEHGARIVEASASGGLPQADGSFTRQHKLACAVLSADCLPVLLCAKDGSLVAAVHGGWRGLAGGVIAAAVAALNVAPEGLSAYLGPAISAEYFEVGPEVRRALLNAKSYGSAQLTSEELTNARPTAAELDNCFRASNITPGHYFADLYQLARVQLNSLGITDVYGGEYCTYGQSQLFYSHRRSQDVGRMASLIWMQ